jgi:hypothetical protein
MARQEDTCWSCEVAWGYRSPSRSAWRAMTHGARPGGRDQPSAPAVTGKARAVAQARLDVDGLADEGGSLAAERSRRIGAQLASVR